MGMSVSWPFLQIAAACPPGSSLRASCYPLPPSAHRAALPAARGAQVCTARFPRGQFFFEKHAFVSGREYKIPWPPRATPHLTQENSVHGFSKHGQNTDNWLYRAKKIRGKLLKNMARSERFELPTFWFVEISTKISSLFFGVVYEPEARQILPQMSLVVRRNHEQH